jgi:hypothetical protein
MRISCWIAKTTNTHSAYQYLLLFHGNDGYVNARVTFTYIACLVTTGLWRFRRRWNDNKLHILREMWSVLGLVVPVVSIDIGAFETSEP